MNQEYSNNMTLHDDVKTWISDRPQWQQRVMLQLLQGQEISDEDIDGYIADFTNGEMGEVVVNEEISVANKQSPPRDPVRLKMISEVLNVNRLARGQSLSFEPEGLTVIYGSNGSGKSGYARIIQSLVRAKVRREILPNVFGEGDKPPLAEIEYEVGNESYIQRIGDDLNEDLLKILFYDESARDLYVTKESKIAYQPALINLLDELAQVTGKIRGRLEQHIKSNVSGSLCIPDGIRDADRSAFLSSLSSNTTDEEIDSNCLIQENDAAELEQLKELEKELLRKDPREEKTRLRSQAENYDLLCAHFQKLLTQLSREVGTRLADARKQVELKKATASAAAQHTFDDEPLEGVGEAVWRGLWEAASRYSALAYSGIDFPNLEEDAVCVLCQQDLGDDAKERMKRFKRFVVDDTAKQLEQAEAVLSKIEEQVGGVIIEPKDISLSVAKVKEYSEPIGSKVDSALNLFRHIKDSLLKSIDGSFSSSSGGISLNAVEKLIEEMRSEKECLLSKLEDVSAEAFDAELQRNREDQEALRCVIWKGENKDRIRIERDRMSEEKRMRELLSQANGASISKKISELTKKYVTDEVGNAFKNEVSALGLSGVTLSKPRVSGGVAQQKPGLVDMKLNASISHVLSEGEQTALGLAGFITEALFDDSKSALVFDDPVTSLDHTRRELVAERIVKLSAERQVIVFTHDIAFCVDLSTQSQFQGVSYAQRYISRSLRGEPGYIEASHPWAAKELGARIEAVDAELTELAKDSDLSGELYVGAVSKIAGRLSEIWERVIAAEIAGRIVDFSSLEVRPNMMKVVASFTHEDYMVFDESYSRISKWVLRHDKHPLMQSDSPSIDELRAELKNIQQWRKRIKGYQNGKRREAS